MIDCGRRLIQRLPFGTLLLDIQVSVPHVLTAENYHTQSEHSLSQADPTLLAQLGGGDYADSVTFYISPTPELIREGKLTFKETDF